MLVGIPGSGKSTFAKVLSEKFNASILSSDEIREELLNDINEQSKNSEVFDVMNNRAAQLLNENRNVIYDATNINRKRRKHLINHIIKADEKVVYYFNVSRSQYIRQNEGRQRIVPIESINKMYKNLHIPVENEGWNGVIYVSDTTSYLKQYKELYEKFIQERLSHDDLFDNLSVYMSEFKDIKDLPQDSSYHSFSVSRHTYYVYKYILENYHEEDRLVMLWAALFHDTGKAFCKSFVNFKGEETKYASFIGHEYVSSQIAAVNLSHLGYDEEFIKSVSTLVQFHMMPMNGSEKKMKEIEQLIGVDLYKKLLILHEADLQAK